MATPSTDQQRFWAHVDKNGPLHPILGRCWLWTAYKDRDGYGQFSVGGRHVAVHRYSYELATGQRLGNLEIDHRCHMSACVNPQHLRPATRKQQGENRAGADRDSRSGVRGVHWSKSKNRWVAKVKHHGKIIHVGYFDDLAEAEAAVIAKRNALFTFNDVDREAV